MMIYHQDQRSPAELGRVLECLLDRPTHVGDITSAVAACLGEMPGRPVLASERALLLSARALAAVGDRAGAEVVMSATAGLAAWVGRIDPASLPAATTRLIEAGLLSAVASPVLGAGTLVRMDLRTLPVQEPVMELVYLPLIHRLVAACLPLWSETSGEGALLVQGLSRHAGGRSVAWLLQALRSRLAWSAEREGWPHPPRLVHAS